MMYSMNIEISLFLETDRAAGQKGKAEKRQNDKVKKRAPRPGSALRLLTKSPLVYFISRPYSICAAMTYSRQAKNFFSLGTGRRWARRAPTGAVHTLTAAMPNKAGR